jgi:tRNA-modifying protein YgfZ
MPQNVSSLQDIKFSTSSGIFPWRPACWLRVSGPDALQFLQGQFTNDLRRLTEAPAVYGLWLTVKGKVVADSFVLRGTAADELWVGSYFSPAATIQERLESHIIADDVTVEDQTTQWAGIAAMGPDAVAALTARPRAGFLFPGRRSAGESREWVYPISADASGRADLAGLHELTVDEMLRRRIAARIPAVPYDAGPADLPNEAGLEGDALSYTKGCYLGQEVMARLKSMGQVRRRLLRVRGRGVEVPPVPGPLYLSERQVGELRSAVADAGGGFMGLAMLSLLHVAPDASLSLAAGAPAAVQVSDSP